MDNAIVCGKSIVTDGAIVRNQAYIGGMSLIYSSQICDSARVYDSSIIIESTIFGNTEIAFAGLIQRYSINDLKIFPYKDLEKLKKTALTIEGILNNTIFKEI
ncbi:hypothetical protein [Faecalibacillus faecis]|uniref:hypothetical protein n=1 Tax=Faecalibacillus faecis TaxID=1982628 RepID=UPI003864F091